MNPFVRWWRRMTGRASGRKAGVSRVVRTKRAACHYTPEEWAQIQAAREQDLKRLAREFGRTYSAVRQAWHKQQREAKHAEAQAKVQS